MVRRKERFHGRSYLLGCSLKVGIGDTKTKHRAHNCGRGPGGEGYFHRKFSSHSEKSDLKEYMYFVE